MKDEKTKSRMPRKNWKAGRGALWFIALSLIVSGLIRLGSGTGAAIAKEVADFRAHDGATTEQACESDESIAALLEALQARESQVEEREMAMDERLAALDVARSEFKKNMAALQTAEEELKATMALSETAAEGDLARLTSVYENMKPKEASLVFEAMAPEFAAGFLGRMRPDAAAAVMAGLQPETAYTISVILAGRNARAPKK